MSKGRPELDILLKFRVKFVCGGATYEPNMKAGFADKMVEKSHTITNNNNNEILIEYKLIR